VSARLAIADVMGSRGAPSVRFGVLAVLATADLVVEVEVERADCRCGQRQFVRAQPVAPNADGDPRAVAVGSLGLSKAAHRST
jgi:hypothetical protein